MYTSQLMIVLRLLFLNFRPSLFDEKSGTSRKEGGGQSRLQSGDFGQAILEDDVVGLVVNVTTVGL